MDKIGTTSNKHSYLLHVLYIGTTITCILKVCDHNHDSTREITSNSPLENYHPLAPFLCYGFASTKFILIEYEDKEVSHFRHAI